MTAKNEFLSALNTIPEGLAGFDTKAIPTLASTSAPNNVEDAIVIQGVLAHNINLILKQFEGMTPVEMFLRIGQRNPVMHSILLAGLEMVTYVDFQVIAPTDGGSYQGFFSTFQVQVSRNLEQVTKLVVAVNGETLELTDDGTGLFTGELPLAIGTYTATITVFYGETSQAQTVSFAVTHFDTVPADGQTYTVSEDDEFEVRLLLPDNVEPEEIGRVSLMVDVPGPVDVGVGYTADLSYDSSSHSYKAYITPVLFGINATRGSWTWQFKDGSMFQKLISFFVDVVPSGSAGGE